MPVQQISTDTSSLKPNGLSFQPAGRVEILRRNKEEWKTMKAYIRALLSAALIAGTATPLLAQDLQATVSAWEERLDARIGVVLRDSSSDWEIAMRADERFPGRVRQGGVISQMA